CISRFYVWSIRLQPPLNCNLAAGALVPMPTFVSEVAPLTPLTLPSTRQLLQSTSDNVPMPAPFLRLPIPRLARAPMMMLPAPLPFFSPAWNPRKVLLSPVELNCPAAVPKKELLLADELKPALRPKKALSLPAPFA